MIGADTTMPPAAAAFREHQHADLDPLRNLAHRALRLHAQVQAREIPSTPPQMTHARRRNVAASPAVRSGPTLPAPCTSARTAPSTTPSA